MKCMLDTNICIYIIKQQPEHVLKQFNRFDLGEIFLSSISVAELRYGVEKSQQNHNNHNILDQFIAPLEILTFDEAAAFEYGKIRSDLEKKGTPIGALDLLIAAHALSSHSILITNNVKEFSRVPQLRIDNWVTIK